MQKIINFCHFLIFFINVSAFFAALAEPGSQGYWFNRYAAAEEKSTNDTQEHQLKEVSYAAQSVVQADGILNPDEEIKYVGPEDRAFRLKTIKKRKFFCCALVFNYYMWRSILDGTLQLKWSEEEEETFTYNLYLHAQAIRTCYSAKQLADKRPIILEYIGKKTAESFNNKTGVVYQQLIQTTATPNLLCMAGTIPATKRLMHEIINNKKSQAEAAAENYVNWKRCLGTKRAQQFAADFNEAQKANVWHAQESLLSLLIYSN